MGRFPPVWHRRAGAVGSALCTPPGSSDRISRQGREITITGITSVGIPEKHCCVLGQEQGKARNIPGEISNQAGRVGREKMGLGSEAWKGSITEQFYSVVGELGLFYSGYLG